MGNCVSRTPPIDFKNEESMYGDIMYGELMYIFGLRGRCKTPVRFICHQKESYALCITTDAYDSVSMPKLGHWSKLNDENVLSRLFVVGIK